MSIWIIIVLGSVIVLVIRIRSISFSFLSMHGLAVLIYHLSLPRISSSLQLWLSTLLFITNSWFSYGSIIFFYSLVALLLSVFVSHSPSLGGFMYGWYLMTKRPLKWMESSEIGSVEQDRIIIIRLTIMIIGVWWWIDLGIMWELRLCSDYYSGSFQFMQRLLDLIGVSWMYYWYFVLSNSKVIVSLKSILLLKMKCFVWLIELVYLQFLLCK